MEPIRQTAEHLLDIQQELMHREPIFHRLENDTSRAELETMTAEDFWETGASGQRYSREYVIDLVMERLSRSREDPWQADDFYCQEISVDHYLLSYTLQQGERLSRRTTLWRRCNNTWQILYHQGTLVSDTGAP